MARKTKPSPRIQYGALPFKEDAAGGLLVLLVTSRPIADRWTIPKGQPAKGLRGPEVAAREAFEEAGLSGRVVGQRPLGHYEHLKRIGADKTVRYSVKLFAFAVEAEAEDWKERAERETRWVDPWEAARMVAADGLAAQIVMFARRQRREAAQEAEPQEPDAPDVG